VSNLLGNAVRHGLPDAPIEVHIDGGSEEAVKLAISNGGDIPADVLPVLFVPFRNKQLNKNRGEGLGLGLFIVSEIVTAHGGSVKVSSDSGRVTLSVVLPRRQGA
jgi:two-component system, sensor histidine kinase and response regulator